MSQGKPLCLIILHQKSQQRFPLPASGDFVIGRSHGNLVFDADPKLSGKHCLIRTSNIGSTLYDLRSRTGIVINGMTLAPGRGWTLKPGEQFRVGDQLFVVEKDRRQVARYHVTPLYLLIAAVLSVLASVALTFPPTEEPAAAAAELSSGSELQLAPWDKTCVATP